MLPLSPLRAGIPELDPAQSRWLGERIFRNECNLQPACLTSWNSGENFPSLGIGHFIWYRSGQTERFTESFPALLRFLETRGALLPESLAGKPDPDSPWPDRSSFYAEFDGPVLSALRDFLAQTQGLQTEFLVQRLRTSAPSLLATGSNSHRLLLLRNFHRVANSHPPHGVYALVDYLNFKGEGTAEGERYQDQGWGLRQVLEEMLVSGADSEPLMEFSLAAERVLRRRVANAPEERDETRWLEGWVKRVASYRPPS